MIWFALVISILVCSLVVTFLHNITQKIQDEEANKLVDILKGINPGGTNCLGFK